MIKKSSSFQLIKVTSMVILLQMGFTSGEGDKEECVESFEELIQVLSNESSYYGMYDYFGHPLDINQLNGTGSHEIIRVFHFHMINITNQNEPNSSKNTFKCCQWNKEECSVYVWYSSFGYLYLSPGLFLAMNSSYHLHSKCLEIPTVCDPGLLNYFGNTVSFMHTYIYGF